MNSGDVSKEKIYSRCKVPGAGLPGGERSGWGSGGGRKVENARASHAGFFPDSENLPQG